MIYAPSFLQYATFNVQETVKEILGSSNVVYLQICSCQDFMWFPYPLISQMPPQYLLLIKLMVSIIYWNLSQSDFVGIVGMGNIWRHRTQIAMYLKLKRQQISNSSFPSWQQIVDPGWRRGGRGEGGAAFSSPLMLAAAVTCLILGISSRLWGSSNPDSGIFLLQSGGILTRLGDI